MVSLLLGHVLVATTLSFGGACVEAAGPADAAAVWALDEHTVERRHRDHRLHPLSEGLETERESDDDPERGERIGDLSALASQTAHVTEDPPRTAHEAPRRATRRSSTRSSRGPPA